jgi:hypothetical protein
VIQEGFYKAGLRCCRKLKSKGIRSIIFTALDVDRVQSMQSQDEFKIVTKSRGYAALLTELKQLLLSPEPSQRFR